MPFLRLKPTLDSILSNRELIVSTSRIPVYRPETDPVHTGYQELILHPSTTETAQPVFCPKVISMLSSSYQEETSQTYHRMYGPRGIEDHRHYLLYFTFTTSATPSSLSLALLPLPNLSPSPSAASFNTPPSPISSMSSAPYHTHGNEDSHEMPTGSDHPFDVVTGFTPFIQAINSSPLPISSIEGLCDALGISEQDVEGARFNDSPHATVLYQWKNVKAMESVLLRCNQGPISLVAGSVEYGQLILTKGPFDVEITVEEMLLHFGWKWNTWRKKHQKFSTLRTYVEQYTWNPDVPTNTKLFSYWQVALELMAPSSHTDTPASSPLPSQRKLFDSVTPLSDCLVKK
ncbi:hypothetical protein BXZ70DRAFT_1011803 [Cristinia sonorae]|uniref:Uncharacterized protein n=1 Tax=Cristinia sonorae TaxID=1940300 RepID=A0A8K0UFS8_9AGAR|nr:hypothetical protein BXZ70DRAFT_1011803 [Cristinia sonorae]